MSSASRRRFLVTAGLILAVRSVSATEPRQGRRRVAILEDGSPGATEARWRQFRNRLLELGWVADENVVFVARFSQGARERLPALAAGLVALSPDVIVAVTTPATRAAMGATSSIPIVFITGDPVGAGLVSNLARPGSNATGQSIMSVDLSAKWIELLTEIAPKARKFAFFGEAGNRNTMAVYRSMQGAAEARGFSTAMLEATHLDDVERAFERMVAEKFDAFAVAASPTILRHRHRIVDLAARHRIPATYAREEYVTAGGLVSYAPDRHAMFRVMADQVHRILQGEHPRDMPIQQPTKFHLTINLRTARALGLDVPSSILLRADRIIE